MDITDRSNDFGDQMTEPTTTVSDLAMLNCAECGDLYVRAAAEQQYYDQRAARPPETCPACRAQLRAARNAELRAGHASGDRAALTPPAPHRSSGSSTHRDRSDASRGPGGDIRLFHAVCAECGRPTEVPFRPRSGRPVFCRDCYNARRGR